MAIAKGKTTTDVEFKRYIGIAPCFIKGVNPTKKEFEAIYDTTLEEEPIYVTEAEYQDGDKKAKCPNLRISFLALPDPNKIGEEIKPISVSIFLQKRYRYNRDKTKVQVIDKYGRTAWVTLEQGKNHEIPMYSNGPANLDKDYRPAYVGEEELTNFLIAYLGIPSVMKYNQTEGKWYMVDNPEDSECRLDHIENYFKNDFTELKEAIALQPNNKIKIMFGVRTNNEGKQYQTAFTQMFLRNSVTNYSNIDKVLQERKNAGAYSTTEFEAADFHEYSVKNTPIVDNTDPFSMPSNPWD